LRDAGRYVRDASDLSVGTGHPQGGNVMSGDPKRGVVGPGCRVHGFENLFVCDASVFPAATTVNPQLTLMAVANMAAPGIAA
jgi:choline dehydrogenase-like flavoprotein